MHRPIDDIQAEINECSRERLTAGSRLAALEAERNEQDRIKHSSSSLDKDVKAATERKSEITTEIGQLIIQIQQLEKVDRELNKERWEAEKRERDLAWRNTTSQSLKHELSSVVSQIKFADSKRREQATLRIEIARKVREAKDAVSNLNKLKDQAAEMREDRKKKKAIGVLTSSEVVSPLDDELLLLDIEIESQGRLVDGNPYLIEEGEKLKEQILNEESILREDIKGLKSKYWAIYKRIALKKYEASIKPLLAALSEVMACDHYLNSDNGLKMLQGLSSQGLLVINSEGLLEISESLTNFDVTNSEVREKLEKELDDLITEDI